MLLLAGCQFTFDNENTANRDESVKNETTDLNRVVNVSKVIDGNTFQLSTGEKVNMICTRAPKKGEDFFEESRKKLETLVMHKNISLEVDTSNTDIHGNLLRYVYLENLSINEKMIREGFAKVHPYGLDQKHCESYRIANNWAIHNHLGMYSNLNYSIPINETVNPENHCKDDKDCRLIHTDHCCSFVAVNNNSASPPKPYSKICAAECEDVALCILKKCKTLREIRTVLPRKIEEGLVNNLAGIDMIPPYILNKDGTWNIIVGCKDTYTREVCEVTIDKYEGIIKQDDISYYEIHIQKDQIFNLAYDDVIGFIAGGPVPTTTTS